MDVIIASDDVTRVRVDGQKFRVDLDRDLSTSGAPMQLNRVRAYDGTTTRATEALVANVKDGPQNESHLIRPHTAAFFYAAMAAPLSAYLAGADEFRSSPGQDFPDDRTLRLVDEGVGVKHDLACRKVSIHHSNTVTGEETLRRTMWLAIDRNYFPVVMEEYDPANQFNVPGLVSMVEEFGQTKSGDWYPAKTKITAYASWLVKLEGKQQEQWIKSVEIKSLDLENEIDPAVFTDVNFSTARMAYAIDRAGKIVDSHPGTPRASGNRSDLSPRELIALMCANDHKLDAVLIRCQFTELTNPRPIMSPIRSIQDEKERTRPKKSFVPTIEHDDTVDPSQLPDAVVLFNFATKHSQEIQDGKISSTSNLTESQAKLLQLMIEKRLKVGLRLHVPEPEPPSAMPAPRLIAIRGKDVILIHDPLREIDLTRKYTSILGEESFAILERTGPNGSLEWMVDSVPSKRDFGTKQFNVLCHLFSMGVGFGSRLKELEIVKVEEGLTHCEGSLEIWPGRYDKARLVVDSRQIVRHAEIQLKDSTITIDTNVVKQISPAFRAASEGHFRWGENKSSHFTTEHFRLSVTSMEFDQSDEQFDALSRSVPPAGEKIIRVRHQPSPRQRCQKTADTKWLAATRGKRGQTLSGHTISTSNRLPSKGSDPFYHGLLDISVVIGLNLFIVVTLTALPRTVSERMLR